MPASSKPQAKKLTVIDFFCGAGGFSEGFRQQGYEIVAGVDNWRPAVKTFNHNFSLDCEPVDMAEFASLERIQALPETDVIVGSPPCTDFSHSNRSGLADKTEGISLIELYLKIVAVKMWQPRSRLKAWYMENVPNSRKYVKKDYSFAALGLAEFALALRGLDVNSREEDATDYGVAQARIRLLTGGMVVRAKEGPSFELPPFEKAQQDRARTVKEVLGALPRPLRASRRKEVADPNYPALKVRLEDLADYSYDTGVFHCQWERSCWSKRNHPYMGTMFVTATKVNDSREALLYLNENSDGGYDGRYRTPTIREIAVLMSYPLSYQFAGAENSKWRLVGNSVAPLVSAALAKTTKERLGIALTRPRWSKKAVLDDLNSSKRKDYSRPPAGRDTKRFRRHLYKYDGITVRLRDFWRGKRLQGAQVGGEGCKSRQGTDSRVQERSSLRERDGSSHTWSEGQQR
ncbi:MAG: DNA cytosine methyltransferase [Betaproteobacteria bacterium AqS2]|uniref:DNA (cytosine-5-)-methyltransferase n=1 Tax=Candidatus Amphirhobacter heronislandensis TaxID=1732024 RepID=A0A930XWA6_9GAMM|nr:DNA cytosine methyltransferase [Betaproteobacteria bacterium AqS2]